MLRAEGAEVEVDERLRALGRGHRMLLRGGTRVLLRAAPRLFGAYYGVLLRSRIARRVAVASLVRSGTRPLLRLVRRHRPDVVVSTYPGTTVVLGRLRATGRVGVPAVATITPASHRSMPAPGVV